MRRGRTPCSKTELAVRIFYSETTAAPPNSSSSRICRSPHGPWTHRQTSRSRGGRGLPRAVSQARAASRYGRDQSGSSSVWRTSSPHRSGSSLNPSPLSPPSVPSARTRTPLMNTCKAPGESCRGQCSTRSTRGDTTSLRPRLSIPTTSGNPSGSFHEYATLHRSTVSLTLCILSSGPDIVRGSLLVYVSPVTGVDNHDGQNVVVDAV